MNTLEQLIQQHGAAMVPLDDICKKHFGCAKKKAREKARLNMLPVPTWRLIDSQRAPLMVRLADLAAHIDAQADAAAAEHAKSQI